MVDKKPSRRRITSDAMFKAMVGAGIFPDDRTPRRVVLDLQAGKAAILYVEYFGDEDLLDVIPPITYVEIHSVDGVT